MQLVRYTFLIIATASISACHTWVPQSIPPREVLLGQVEQAQVRTSDGKRHVLQFPEVRGDRIVGLRAVTRPVDGAVLHQRQMRQVMDTVSIPIADVASVALTRTSPTRT